MNHETWRLHDIKLILNFEIFTAIHRQQRHSIERDWSMVCDDRYLSRHSDTIVSEIYRSRSNSKSITKHMDQHVRYLYRSRHCIALSRLIELDFTLSIEPYLTFSVAASFTISIASDFIRRHTQSSMNLILCTYDKMEYIDLWMLDIATVLLHISDITII